MAAPHRRWKWTVVAGLLLAVSCSDKGGSNLKVGSGEVAPAQPAATTVVTKPPVTLSVVSVAPTAAVTKGPAFSLPESGLAVGYLPPGFTAQGPPFHSGGEYEKTECHP